MGTNQNGQADPSSPDLMRTVTSSPMWVGLLLILAPGVALFVGMRHLEDVRLVGLPLMAIFGIVILFGTLALVAMLFKHLNLEDNRQPLALPEGSIRAAIALSLIVLFAIIAIMLFQGMDGKTFKIERLTLEQRDALLVKPGVRIEGVEESCVALPNANAPCAEADRRYVVMVRVSPGSDSVDMAKQLLVLVGTLMTSVTSYYFAARSVTTTERRDDAAAQAAATKGGPGGAQGGGASVAGAAAASGASASAAASTADEHVDGCDVAISDPTADEDLPPARGGVAPLGG